MNKLKNETINFVEEELRKLLSSSGVDSIFTMNGTSSKMLLVGNIRTQEIKSTRLKITLEELTENTAVISFRFKIRSGKKKISATDTIYLSTKHTIQKDREKIKDSLRFILSHLSSGLSLNFDKFELDTCLENISIAIPSIFSLNYLEEGI